MAHVGWADTMDLITMRRDHAREDTDDEDRPGQQAPYRDMEGTAGSCSTSRPTGPRGAGSSITPGESPEEIYGMTEEEQSDDPETIARWIAEFEHNPAPGR